MRRRVGVTAAQWHRYLWRRHVQHILHWGERREEGDPNGFTHDINWLLPVVLFSDQPNSQDDGGNARGSTAGGAAEGGGVLSSGVASATLEAAVCSEETSTGRSAESPRRVVGARKFTNTNSVAPAEGEEDLRAVAQNPSASAQHHVVVMGDEPPVGSQEPQEMSIARIEVLVTTHGEGATRLARHPQRGHAGRGCRESQDRDTCKSR
jgi:hypothetical protein